MRIMATSWGDKKYPCRVESTTVYWHSGPVGKGVPIEIVCEKDDNFKEIKKLAEKLMTSGYRAITTRIEH